MLQQNYAGRLYASYIKMRDVLNIVKARSSWDLVNNSLSVIWLTNNIQYNMTFVIIFERMFEW